jgi:hypothetical protein
MGGIEIYFLSGQQRNLGEATDWTNLGFKSELRLAHYGANRARNQKKSSTLAEFREPSWNDLAPVKVCNGNVSPTDDLRAVAG